MFGLVKEELSVPLFFVLYTWDACCEPRCLFLEKIGQCSRDLFGSGLGYGSFREGDTTMLIVFVGFGPAVEGSYREEVEL